MSPTDTSSPSPRRFAIRCHPAETGTAAAPPRAHHLDPAVLVGLSLAFARQHAVIPSAVSAPLIQLAAEGDATCRLVVDWLDGRAGLASGSSQPTPAASASSEVARSHRQRALEGPRGNNTSPPPKPRGRPSCRFSQTAIIAATEETR